MRVLTWNIRHGGGTRIPAICRHIADIQPGLLALTEFRARNERSLCQELNRLGYPFIVTSNPVGRKNGLLIASRWPIDRVVDDARPKIDEERWLTVRLNALDLDVCAVHIPGSDDNKFTDGYGISGLKRKELMWECVLNFAASHANRPAIILGDFNTGLQIDAEGTPFDLSSCMDRLIGMGFVDTWRQSHPGVREYTWYSKRKDKKTGASLDLNGFRLDYIYASPALGRMVADGAIIHDARHSGASDHASVIANINIAETVVAGAADDTSVGNSIAAVAVIEKVRPWESATSSAQVRFDLAPGELPDMICGENGRNLVQAFRPAYVTARWANGVLVEARIWGPRLLKDGQLGKRELDHLWKTSVAAGGVDLRALPDLVAERLRGYVI